MSAAKITREFIDSIEEAKLFEYDDIPCANKSAVAIELSRLVKKGIIKKIAKGKFYKPKIRPFGEVEPGSDEKISSYLKDDDSFYETGINAFRQLGLTTQVAKTRTIATKKRYTRKIEIDNTVLQFIPKRVDAPKEDADLLQILDALKDIKKIPATTPQKIFLSIKNIIKNLNIQKQKKLAKYALSYPPRVRALLGAILKEIRLWEEAFELKRSLNPFTKYKIGIDSDILPSKNYWNLV